MSSLNMIKGIKQKLGDTAIDYDNGGFSAFTPFGTDGIYVDMNSRLNLEEQLLIGGNSDISIIENDQNNTIIIIEKYKHREKSGTNIIDVYDYSTVTIINDKVEELLLIDDSSKNLLKIESVDDSPTLIANFSEDGDDAQILINLYQGEYTGTSSDKLIHRKLITIELDGMSSIDSVIDEDLAYWQGENIPDVEENTSSGEGENNG